jgi:hypothetical protein
MVPDEDRRRGDRGLSLQPRGAAVADRPATATGRGARGRDRGGHRRAADLRLPAGPVLRAVG